MSLNRIMKNSFVTKFANVYKQAVDRRMKALGLRADDLTNEGDVIYKRALQMLPKDVLESRSRRLNRAIDLGAKHQELNPAAQAAQQTWQPYVHDLYDDLHARQRERDTYA